MKNAPYNLISNSSPQKVEIHLTNNCNLRCYMCNANKKEDRDLPKKLLHRLEPAIKECKMVIFSGGGEPTIAKEFVEKVKWVKKINPDAELMIFTNGVKFASEDFSKKVISLFDRIHISMNGIKSYETIMKGNSFKQMEKTLENIKKFKRKGQRIELGFILMKRNIKDIVPAAKIARKYNIDAVCYKDLWVKEESIRKESIRHNPRLYKKALEEVRKAKNISKIYFEPDPKLFAKESYREIFNFTYLLFRNLKQTKIFLLEQLNKLGEKINPEIICKEPWEKIRVGDDGIVCFCCNGLTSVGDLNNQGIEEIWNGQEAQNYRKGILTGKYYKNCIKCKKIQNKKEAFEKI